MTSLLTGLAFGIGAFLFISLPCLLGWGGVCL